MAISGSYFKRTALWQYNEAWRARRRESNEDFLARSSAAASTFGSAQLNLVNGLGSIAQQMAVQRIQSAQQEPVKKALSGLNLTV
jgi:hypothetical protein